MLMKFKLSMFSQLLILNSRNMNDNYHTASGKKLIFITSKSILTQHFFEKMSNTKMNFVSLFHWYILKNSTFSCLFSTFSCFKRPKIKSIFYQEKKSWCFASSQQQFLTFPKSLSLQISDIFNQKCFHTQSENFHWPKANFRKPIFEP